jgi:branched-chain amino acid transport system permease protein
VTQFIVNGLMLGGIYGLMAVAYTMVYGVIGLVNFAFGEIFMFGAFGALIMMQSSMSLFGETVATPGLPFPVALVCGLLIGGVVGVIVERVAYRPLRRAPILSMLIAAIAYPNPVGGEPLTFLGARIQPIDLLIFGLAIAAMALLTLVVQRTAAGRAMRAIAQDGEAARLMGINVDRVILVTFFIGSVLAALAGILYAAKFRFAAPAMGFVPGLHALVAAVLGGIGNIPGAFLGGLLLGVLETLGSAYLPQGSAYRDVIAFLALGAILWLRPEGLLGARVPERA